MEENYSNEEQVAIISVLHNLVYADFRQRGGEASYLKTCMDKLGVPAEGFVPIPRNELPTKAYTILKQMSADKKQAFSLMMTEMSRSDTHFGPRERKFVKEILEYCEIPFVHKKTM